MNWKIPLFDLDYGPEEENAVLEVLRSRWLTMGEVTQRFEEAFAEFCGVKHAVAVSNGTVALHLACLAAGIGPGDEVIVPALTFVATAACVRYVGATPIFADVVSENDLTLSPASVEALITARTRAIILMHYGGYACDMPAFRALAARHHLILIEDAAHAPGAARDGARAGSWGQVAAFSFFSNKNLATGEGGMLTTDDDEIAAQLRRLRSHGMTSLTWDRHRGHAWSYDVTDLGYNYRPSEMLSALGLVQLARLESNNHHRRELTAVYHELLAELAPQVQLPFAGHPGESACHIMPVLLPVNADRLAFMDGMKTRGIQTSIHYPPIPEFTAYRATSGGMSGLPVTRAIASRQVTLPLYARMSFEDIKTVAQAVRDALLLL
ncbi:MAG: DegT/DnrJ/EryC1/StrS family aminotransferase [Anaerolineales bacterium]|jgi:dTDP-4-amino-4,6-dideoxygalactose transaminase|nr:DegT/DnrJ/EryC1/StrS family aminotransferase [Anaerolineales bacterium]